MDEGVVCGVTSGLVQYVRIVPPPDARNPVTPISISAPVRGWSEEGVEAFGDPQG